MYRLAKQFCESLNDLIPATAIAEELPLAQEITAETDANMLDENIAHAEVSGSLLTLFGKMRKFYNDARAEVLCSHEEFTRQEMVRDLAKIYSNMNAIDRAALQDKFEEALQEAIENLNNANNPTKVMKNAARAEVLDLVLFKENCIKDLEIAKEEFKRIFGKSELDKTLVKIGMKTEVNRSAPRYYE